MAFEDPQFKTFESNDDNFEVIDKNDDPKLWEHTAGLDAWDKYKSVPGGDVYVLMGSEFNALKKYLESDVCQIVEPVRSEVLQEMRDRTKKEKAEDRNERESMYKDAA